MDGSSIIVTHRYRVRGVAAARELERMAAAVNDVWNFCGTSQDNAERWDKRWPTAIDLEKLTAGSSRELGVQSDTVGLVCQRFAQARARFKARPRWRGKRSLGWVPFKGRTVRLIGDRLTLLGRSYRLRMTRGVGAIRSGSFSQDASGRWYANLVTERKIEPRGASGEVGIDLGLKTLATFSDGGVIENPRHVRVWADKLATAKRAGRKARARAIHAKIAACRRDYLHKHSADLVRRYGRIVVGGVEPAQLARTRMATSVLDAGWSTFRTQLRYKAMAHGVEYVEVDERNTTRTCSACLARTGPTGLAGLGVRSWACGSCGAVHDRDVNAAINILALGRSDGLQRTGTTASAGVSAEMSRFAPNPPSPRGRG